MTPQEEQLAKRLLSGPIPIGLLLHIQDSAKALSHGTIELIFQGEGGPIDVVTKQRTRFEKNIS